MKTVEYAQINKPDHRTLVNNKEKKEALVRLHLESKVLATDPRLYDIAFQLSWKFLTERCKHGKK